jgi:tetratricopeptide (TPR) repeat protein
VFSGIPLVERLSERTCGVWVVHIETGQTIGFLRFESGVQEIFAVQAPQGIRFPELMEWNDERLAHSYVLPDEALAEVRLPTEEEIARSPAYQLQLGNKHYEEGKLEEAIAAYRRCLEAEPKHADARFNLGVALGDVELYEEACACLEEVLRGDPKRAEAYNSLGYLASRRGEPHKAISY